MPTTIKPIIASQLLASLAMMNQCVQQCPPELWDNSERTVAKYPFWLVAYHTLCYLDLYLSPGKEVYELRPEFHPGGWQEFDDEYPSRTFSQQELLAYIQICREKIATVLGDGPNSETAASLAGPSGFSRLQFTRTELHLYNLRHLQHHTGQLTAFLRRGGVETSWVKAGWK